ncbi:uncharacterized protein LOC111679739 [Lucilia cuprina]|uniref:uncharacterized protein LOC111679739 n=1 Tax=Lucilia cuprina TaxID=7375 RepID=UPI001F06853F|nr:uncharacterized protein LOC111679739 [Lucilia cuprina]
MRERSHTTPRRRGPKQPLPQDALYNDSFDSQESPYYTIDNTEDIYSTTLLPSQRCYVDPWDLENYDYVRKKIEQPISPRPQEYYETSLSPSPIEEPMHSNYYYDREPIEVPPRMASTMPRNRRRSSHYQCQMECCQPQPQRRRPSGLYDVGGVDKYDDYMTLHMAQKFQNALNLEDVEQNIYTGFGGLSSSSSTEPHSSLGDDYHTMTLQRHVSNYGILPQRRISKPAPKLEFPSPPPMPPTYDYCNPYATLPPCCSASDCYECLSQAQQQQQIYGTHPIYGTTPATGPSSCYGCAGMTGSQTLGRRPSSSLYSGIYSSKFGMSKKGLLQIDYSCSWNDLDRVMGKNY